MAPLLVVGKDTSIEELVRRMTSLGEDRIILVEEGDGSIAGLISLGDLARHLKDTRRSDFHMHSRPVQSKGYRASRTRHGGRSILHQVTAETAGDIMDPQIIYCSPEDRLSHAGEKMIDGHVIKILPVMDRSNKLVGALHLLDVIQYLLEHPSQD